MKLLACLLAIIAANSKIGLLKRIAGDCACKPILILNPFVLDSTCAK